MRKLKLQMQLTLDGFVAGTNGEMGFMISDWDQELKNYVGKITEPVDGILLGRKLAEEFIPYWKSVAENPEDPEHLAGIKFTETSKVVFSRTRKGLLWGNNSRLAKDELQAEITRLKAEEGGDLIAYGGGNFVAELISSKLIDEYHFFVNPVAIGKGMSIFGSLHEQLRLKLSESRLFDCGAVVLFYKPVSSIVE